MDHLSNVLGMKDHCILSHRLMTAPMMRMYYQIHFFISMNRLDLSNAEMYYTKLTSIRCPTLESKLENQYFCGLLQAKRKELVQATDTFSRLMQFLDTEPSRRFGLLDIQVRLAMIELYMDHDHAPKALLLCLQAISMANEYQAPLLQQHAKILLAQLLYKFNYRGSAIQLLNCLYEDVNEDMYNCALYWSVFGQCIKDRDPARAVAYFQDAIKCYERMDMTSKLKDMYALLSVCYHRLSTDASGSIVNEKMVEKREHYAMLWCGNEEN